MSQYLEFLRYLCLTSVSSRLDKKAAICFSKKKNTCTFDFMCTIRLKESLSSDFVNALSPGDKNKFANNVDPDEVAHIEPPHLELHCLLSSL